MLKSPEPEEALTLQNKARRQNNSTEIQTSTMIKAFSYPKPQISSIEQIISLI